MDGVGAVAMDGTVAGNGEAEAEADGSVGALP